MYKNDVSNSLDVPAQLINGRTLIPLRAVSEAFNCQVGWDGNTNTVSIIDDFTNYTMLYTLNDRSKCFLTQNVPNQLNNGWYTEPVQTLYTLEKSAVFKKAEVNAQLDLGWSTEPLVTMYFPDGRTKVVKRSEVEANKNDGWYTEPVQTLYAPGKSAVFKQSEVEAQLAVGWYTEPVCIMYAPDGRTINILESEVEAYKKLVGIQMQEQQL